MITDLINRLNDYCVTHRVYDLDNLSKELLSELKYYGWHYVDTVDTKEDRWCILAENIYCIHIDHRDYYIGVWEVETLDIEHVSIRNCGCVLDFYEVEPYTKISYRRKEYYDE